jgi:tight adherence protein C
MILALLIGLVLVGTSIALALRAAAFGSARTNDTLENIAAYGFRAQLRERAGDSRARIRLTKLADGIGALYRRHTSEEREREVRDLLRAAGMYRMRPVTFLGYRILIAAGVALFWLWILSAAGAAAFAVLLLPLSAAAVGWIMPMFILRKRAAQRLMQIDREVPELVDLLVTTVEAGVGFGAALQITARRVEGPLGDELRVALSEQSMGLTINEALTNMLARANSPAMRLFVQAVLQGETLGVSIGKILRDLAVDMRKRRRQSAEERAQKAPTKIIFPLVVLILPAMLIISIGPFIVSLARAFGSV